MAESLDNGNAGSAIITLDNVDESQIGTGDLYVHLNGKRERRRSGLRDEASDRTILVQFLP